MDARLKVYSERRDTIARQLMEQHVAFADVVRRENRYREALERLLGSGDLPTRWQRWVIQGALMPAADQGPEPAADTPKVEGREP